MRRHAILELASATLGDTEARRWADSAAEDRVERAIDQHEVWLLVENGTPKGWIEIHGDRVEGLYVRGDAAQRGIGSSLMAHAEARIASAGHASATLEASENAKEFYLGRGFRVLGGPPADGAIPMHKFLGA